MTKVLRLVVLAALGGALAALGATPKVMVLPLTGVIGPASSDFVERGLARAAADGAQLAVLEIDTPGGLDTSMRDIIKAILASPVPVATFVAPSGARAASAGTYILYASHIAAMAPGTNLGAATPINVGMPGATPPAPPKSGKEPAADKPESSPSGDDAATLARKQVHDAAAYIRGLAQLRGHNAEWGERAVREAVSLSADEALAQHVIDVEARDVPDLLAKLDGRKVTTATATDVVLATRGAEVVTFAPDWRNRLLSVITNPSVALILMMIGVYGLFFEFSNPGFVLPGIVGAIALLLGLFALHMLPINYAGLALILLGIGFMVAEVFIGSFGALGVGGIIAFVIGAVLLIDTDVPAFGIPWSLIAALTLFTGAFIFFVSGAALKARRRPVVTGSEGLVGSGGMVLDDFAGDGWARVQSEQWRIRSAVPLKRGQSVRVTGRDGLVLTVVPADSPEKGA
jgi:membrane-bound serine protease (ClpP class)